MRSSISTCRYIFPLLVWTSWIQLIFAGLINKNVVRSIDTKASFIREAVIVEVENTGTKLEPCYYVAVPPALAPALSQIVVKTEEDVFLLITNLTSDIPKDFNQLPKGSRLFKANFFEPLAKGLSMKIEVQIDYKDFSTPIPAKINIDNLQNLLLYVKAYFFSPYKSLKEESKVVIGRSSIIRYDKEPKPVSAKVQSTTTKDGLYEGSQIILGPYENVAPFTDMPFMIYMTNPKPLPVVTKFVKDVHVSLWGNVAFVEDYDLRNDGASTGTSWSRIDYTMLRTRNLFNDLEGMNMLLPKEAANIFYRDVVGNITTSHLRKPTKKGREFHVFYRFPLFGGWKNQFWISYDVPLSTFLVKKSSSFGLTVPFLSSGDEFVIEDYTLRVSLPEGATNVRVITPKSFKFDQEALVVSDGNLNFLGRPTLILKKDMFLSESSHGKYIYVTYDYSGAGILRAPFFVITGIFGFFLAIMMLSRLELSLTGDQAKQLKEKEQQYLVQILEKHEDIVKRNQMSKIVMMDFTNADQVAAFTHKRDEIETFLRKAEGQISSIQTLLQDSNSEYAVKVKELLDLYKKRREALMKLMNTSKISLSDKISTESVKQEQEKLTAVIEESQTSIDEIMSLIQENI